MNHQSAEPHEEIPSWDAERDSAPERPHLAAGLVIEPRLPQPPRVRVATLLVLVGVASFFAVLVSAVLHLDEIREGFIAVLNDNLEDDYAEDDKENAVHIMIAIIGGLALLITLGLFMSANAVRAGKNPVGRIFMIILIVLYLPAAFLASTLRQDNWLELLLSAFAAFCFLTAVVLLHTPPVSAWLRQHDKEPPKPLTDFKDDAPPQPAQVRQASGESSATKRDS